MADSTTRLPISIDEIDGAALATPTTPGVLKVEQDQPVALASGTEVDLASGAEVALVAGTEVDLATGAEVGIATAANTIQISQTAGENGVDLVKVGGNAVAAPTTSGVLVVGIDPAQNTVSLGAGGTKESDYQTVNVSKNLGTATINFKDISGTTGKLCQIHLFSQTQMRVEVNGDTGGTPALKAVTGTPAGGGPYTFKPCSEDAITQAAGAGNNFQLVVVNLDKRKDADIYAFAEWVEV